MGQNLILFVDIEDFWRRNSTIAVGTERHLWYSSRHTQVPATTLWGLSYFVEISLWGMYFGAQLVERD